MWLDDKQMAALPAAAWLINNEKLRELLAEWKKKGKMKSAGLMEAVSLGAVDAVSGALALRLKYKKRNYCDFHDATGPVPSTTETWEREDSWTSTHANPMEDLRLRYDH